jgi:uncharacterized MAPEG superfamily protein
MSVADWCILAAALLPLLVLAPAKGLGGSEYDNARPREPAFYAEGWRARAWGAHLNGYEAFPFFAAAILVAEMRAVPQLPVDVLAVCFIAVRLAYAVAYVADRASLRSMLWGIGLLINLTIMVLPAVTSGPGAS